MELENQDRQGRGISASPFPKSIGGLLLRGYAAFAFIFLFLSWGQSKPQ